MDEVLSRIEATDLRADATEHDIMKLCGAAREHGFAGVCVPPMHVRLASTLLPEDQVVANRRIPKYAVATVIGFPLGNTDTLVKQYEAKAALSNGATELDMVLNRSLLKQGQVQAVISDIRYVVEAEPNSSFGQRPVGPHKTKVIVEISKLTFEELALAVECIHRAGAHYVKTSSGYGRFGIRREDILGLSALVDGTELKIKAAQGIDKYWTAKEYVELGADRLGVSQYEAVLEDKARRDGKNINSV